MGIPFNGRINLFAKGTTFAMQYKKQLSPHVETICLLSRLSNRKPDSYVNLSIGMDEYREIKGKQGLKMNEIEKISDTDIMDNYFKSDNIVNDIQGIIEASQKVHIVRLIPYY